MGKNCSTQLQRSTEIIKEKEDIIKQLQEDAKKQDHNPQSDELDRFMKIIDQKEVEIANLLDENEELKRKYRQEGNRDDNVLNDEINRLQDDAQTLQLELEDVNRHNSILNEEVEEWLVRGSEMENEIEQLRAEVREWREKASKMKR